MAATVDERAAEAVGRLCYGLVHVRVGRADHDLARSRQPAPELAALVVTPARPVDVRERCEDGLRTRPNSGHRLPDLALHVGGQCRRGAEALSPVSISMGPPLHLCSPPRFLRTSRNYAIDASSFSNVESRAMEWLNYHHLFYFWKVVRTGSITRACEELRLAPPTISAQLRSLEEQMGEKLLARSGRSLVPTEMGRLVFRYAEEIFGLGQELMDAVKQRPTGRPLRVVDRRRRRPPQGDRARPHRARPAPARGCPASLP